MVGSIHQDGAPWGLALVVAVLAKEWSFLEFLSPHDALTGCRISLHRQSLELQRTSLDSRE